VITLKQRVQLQVKTATQTALGQTVTWKPVQDYWARVIPLDVRTIAQYQQLNTEVTHKIILRGTVTVSLGAHRVKHGAFTYQPQATAKHNANMTEVVVKEV
jgi:head-tail adaptor